MEQIVNNDQLKTALIEFCDRHAIGSYLSHESTTRGLTLNTTWGSASLPKPLIHKLIWKLDNITDEDIRQVVQGWKRQPAKQQAA